MRPNNGLQLQSTRLVGDVAELASLGVRHLVGNRSLKKADVLSKIALQPGDPCGRPPMKSPAPVVLDRPR